MEIHVFQGRTIIDQFYHPLNIKKHSRNLSHTSDFELGFNICNFAVNNTGTHAFIADESKDQKS